MRERGEGGEEGKEEEKEKEERKTGLFLQTSRRDRRMVGLVNMPETSTKYFFILSDTQYNDGLTNCVELRSNV